LTQLPDWARALGGPLFAGRIRATCADFNVVEELDIELTGDGEHDWLQIRKTDANTHWVAEQLARHAAIPARDVGYAGLKDRRAVTTQWFSVRRKPGVEPDWTAFSAEGVEILETRRHNRKLRRGAHQGNAFRLAIRSDTLLPGDLVAERLECIAGQGVPNYFGEQRFGRDGANLELGRAVLSGRRLSRHKRSIGISALRSAQFNEELDARVRAGSWNTLLPGDIANLDGTGSVFPIDDVTADLERRCAEMDIHPCGTLKAIPEVAVAASQRPLRTRVSDLEWELQDAVLWLEFSLGRGAYATAVLREIVLNT
jgi:tRNA pseudouridine13 synthase